jgi:hypothetical protein
MTILQTPQLYQARDILWFKGFLAVEDIPLSPPLSCRDILMSRTATLNGTLRSTGFCNYRSYQNKKNLKLLEQTDIVKYYFTTDLNDAVFSDISKKFVYIQELFNLIDSKLELKNNLIFSLEIIDNIKWYVATFDKTYIKYPFLLALLSYLLREIKIREDDKLSKVDNLFNSLTFHIDFAGNYVEYNDKERQEYKKIDILKHLIYNVDNAITYYNSLSFNNTSDYVTKVNILNFTRKYFSYTINK